MVNSELEKDVNRNLINLGSCGLHIVHGAFKKGADALSWNADSFISSAYWLFKDSPARREDYCKAIGVENPLMPEKFCKTRWVENVTVTERLNKICERSGSRKVPNPGTKSWQVVRDGCKDILMPAKLAFLLSYAKEVHPFLTIYQSDKPMIPFLAKDLYKLMKSIMQRFIKKTTISDATTIKKLMAINVKDKTLHLQPSEINVGYTTEKRLEELIQQKKISEKTQLEFRLDCTKCLQTLMGKLQDKSPLNYSIVRNLSCLDPSEMAKDEDLSVSKLKKVLNTLVETNHIREDICDDVIKQYQKFVCDIVTSRKVEFAEFNCTESRLDTLFHKTMNKNKEYDKLWMVVSMLLLLSHGNASVERGFSVNRNIEIENLGEKSYVAQRLICDHLKAVGGIDNVVITNSLLTSASSARHKYHAWLDEQKAKKIKVDLAQKRKGVMDEIEEIKSKKQRLEKDAEALEVSADEFALKADNTGNLTLIAKSNSLRQTAKNKRKDLCDIEQKLNDKLKEIKSIYKIKTVMCLIMLFKDFKYLPKLLRFI